MMDSQGALNHVSAYIKQDLAAVGAASPTYTMLAFVQDSTTVFSGFAVFDPTSKESIDNAYFEFSSSESTSEWALTGK